MSAEAKLTETKTAMLLHTPFFASLLLDMMQVKLGKFPQVFPPGNETMATDGKTVWVDEDFLNDLKLPEAVFVMCHEVGHAMWQHMSRGKTYKDTGFEGQPFDPRLWNVAGDYVINAMLVDSNIGKMPKIGLYDPSIASGTDLVDDVYRKLLEKKQQGGGSGGDGEGESGGGHNNQGPDGEGDGTLDTHIYPDQSAESEVEWKRAVKTAADAAKAQGKMPAGMERFVDELLKPKVKWTEKLRSAFTKKIGRDASDWNKLHRRRYITQGVIMPSYKGFGCGEVVFVIDTSGSMSDHEMKQGLSECDNILTDCSPENVWLIGCDADVETVTELGPHDTLANNRPACTLGGGGGTSFIPPFEWCEENNVKPACLVYFTDMGGTFPDYDPGFPVIWCDTTGYRPRGTDFDKVPGEIIRVELNDEPL
jgi:predicted metal-dependent peptidase